MFQNKPCSAHSVLIVGNFLSDRRGTMGVCEELAQYLRLSGWSVTTTSSSTNRILRLLNMIMTALRYRNKYCVVYIEVYSGLAFVWAEILLTLTKMLGKPVILTLHGGNLPLFAQRWPNRVRYLLKVADAVTTPSIYIQSAFSGIRTDIVLVRNAIDLQSYTFRYRPNPSPNLAWLRAFHAIYSPTSIVQVLTLLSKDFPNIELTMFGPDKGDGSLNSTISLAKESRISNQLHIPGPIPKSEIPYRLGAFDIFLNTTTMESFGVSVVEAAALGMCIVTTNVGELPHIWTHEHDALLVPPNDSEAMANAVRRILTESGLAERLSRNARKTAEQYDWSNTLPLWTNLMEDLVNRQ